MKYWFCIHDETIKHLFIGCQFAKFLWRIVCIWFGLYPPLSIAHMYGTWLNGVDSTTKNQILVGASAFCWDVWLSWNDIVCGKSPIKTYVQVLFRGTYWPCFWTHLRKKDGVKQGIKEACGRLDVLAMQIFAHHGCWFTNRIGPWCVFSFERYGVKYFIYDIGDWQLKAPLFVLDGSSLFWGYDWVLFSIILKNFQPILMVFFFSSSKKRVKGPLLFWMVVLSNY